MATTEPRLSSLQQERSRETRRRLVRAAEGLWRAKGFDETTVEEICDRAGMSKGSFYFYFPTKEHLLLELGISTSDRVLDDVAAERAADLPVREALRQAMASIVRRIERTPKPLLARTLSAIYGRADEWVDFRGDRADFGKVFESIFRRAQERGEIAPEHRPEELASLLGSTSMAALFTWAHERTDLELFDLLWWRGQIVLNGATLPIDTDRARE